MANASDGNSEHGLLLDSEILSEQDELDEFDSSEKSHTMTFKCIRTNWDTGSSHQMHYMLLQGISEQD